MGLFGKLEENIHHGGVKVQLQAPEATSTQDASLSATITVTASDQPAQINSVRLEIVAVSFDRNFAQPMGTTRVNGNIAGQPETVAQAEDPQPFTLNPGESKVVQLSIVMNQQNQPGADGAMGQAMNALNHLDKYLSTNRYAYSLRATADVDGVALDPSASQKLQIQGAGGAGHLNISL